MLEVQFGKYVKLVCSLNVGDTVIVDGWGYQLDGKECVIEDIKDGKVCESGILVKIDKYPDYIDSNWVRVIKFAGV